ncbi:phosphotransferase family protein [Candidatus Harpocratesius sp.]
MEREKLDNLDSILPPLVKYLKRRRILRKFLYSHEKFRDIERMEIIEQNAKNAIIDLNILYTTSDRIPDSRKYKLILYLQAKKHNQMALDLRQIKTIKDLDIYPLGKILVESSFQVLGFPFLLLEDLPNENIIHHLRISLGLRNSRAVGKRVNKYLQHRVWFRRRGQVLMEPGEKFIEILNCKELAFGLNNAVFEIVVHYFNAENQESTRIYILRIYPRNENLIKAQNESQNLQKIQDLDIPKAKFYLYEEDPSYIGYRFLILEKLPGQPVLETIHTFTQEETRQFLADLAKILGKLHNIRTKKFQSYYLNVKSTRRMIFSDYIFSEVAQVLKSFKDIKLHEEFHTDIKFLWKWFKGHKPLLRLSGYSFIHGDMRPSNIIVNGTKIAGLIDWEMSCYSDPAQDLGWTLFFFKLYKNLEKERGFFFEEYWKFCEKYDFEARVFFYEFLAAMKLYIYARANRRDNPEKYESNKNFFSRVEKAFPQYLQTVTYKLSEDPTSMPEIIFDEDTQREVIFHIKNILTESLQSDLEVFSPDFQEKLDNIAEKILQLFKEYI